MDQILGASSYFIYIVKYISLDNYYNVFVPMNPILFYGIDSVSFSIYRKTSPVYAFGDTTYQGLVKGATEIRGKLTFPQTHINPYFQLHEQYIREIDNKSKGSATGDHRNKVYLMENLKELLETSGDINAVTTNPFDIWLFKKRIDGGDGIGTESASFLLQCQIDTSTIIYDALTQTSNEAQFYAKIYNDELPKKIAEQILLGRPENYQEFTKKMIKAKNLVGKHPTSLL